MGELIESGPVSSPMRSQFTDAEKERYLTALALNSGNAKRTWRELKARLSDSVRCPDESTLRMWRDKDPELYEKVRSQVLPGLRERLSEDHFELATTQTQAARTLTELVIEKVENGELDNKELVSALNRFDWGSAIHSQRGLEMRGEPTTVVHAHLNLKETEDALAKKGITIERPVIEGTAEELPDEA